MFLSTQAAERWEVLQGPFLGPQFSQLQNEEIKYHHLSSPFHLHCSTASVSRKDLRRTSSQFYYSLFIIFHRGQWQPMHTEVSGSCSPGRWKRHQKPKGAPLALCLCKPVAPHPTCRQGSKHCLYMVLSSQGKNYVACGVCRAFPSGHSGNDTKNSIWRDTQLPSTVWGAGPYGDR